MDTKQILDTLKSEGFHLYFNNPQQAIDWPGVVPLAEFIIKSEARAKLIRELKAENDALKAENARLKAGQPQMPQTRETPAQAPQMAPVAPVVTAPSSWDAQANIVAQIKPQVADTHSHNPTPSQTIKRGGIHIEGVDPIIPPKLGRPLGSGKRQQESLLPSPKLGQPLPPMEASAQGPSVDANGRPLEPTPNPHYLGAMVPPAPDPQEFVLDLSGSEAQASPSPVSLDLASPPPMAPPPPHMSIPEPKPLTTDDIPPEVLARMNAPFPTQVMRATDSAPVQMTKAVGSYFDGILEDF